ncbi:hypothetical protein [Paenisporosarcina sp. TG-14]|uniref:hypothetical protein n=1 Tax=Paenisporosarcina sp. TG-14 TaxID=1231057 RepID=UPI0002E45A7A|nr:hypothetical protein [Paenisporosarcina sp. TG-14]
MTFQARNVWKLVYERYPTSDLLESSWAFIIKSNSSADMFGRLFRNDWAAS